MGIEETVNKMRDLREYACATESTDTKINQLLILTELLIDTVELLAQSQAATDRRIDAIADRDKATTERWKRNDER